jgi:hypothetical protein
VLPADVYKSDHVHVVPLVPSAVEILDQVLTYHLGQSGDYVFSGTDGKKRLSGWSKGHARMMRAICAVSGEQPDVPWTPHDLRRTVATRIAEKLGVGGEQLIKRVLGHADGSVTAIYNRYGYIKEMRAVLERWADDLTAESEPRIRPLFRRLSEAFVLRTGSIWHSSGRAVGEPHLHFVLDPSHRMRSDVHAHRKVSFRLELVELGLAESSHIDDLCQAQHAD